MNTMFSNNLNDLLSKITTLEEVFFLSISDFKTRIIEQNNIIMKLK